MTFGEDPFRKRDTSPPEQPPGQPPEQPPAGDGAPHQQQNGQQQYGQPYGYPPYGYPPYGQPAGAPPDGHLGWAITAVVFFWPLAIAAFINYARVESLWYRGDWAGSQRASDAVKRYGIIALCIGLAIAVLWLAFAATFVATSSSCVTVGGGSC